MFSILIPTFNNIKYLELCINSIKKNSIFNHQIIAHVNIGDDGTLDYLTKNNIEFTHTKYNSGICEGINKAAKLAKKWAYHYWDGSRKINYGGYKYIQGRWYPVIKKMIKFYKLKKNCRILDIGCGKGFFLKDFKDLLPNADVHGLDISKYAIKNSHPKVKNKLKIGSASKLPWKKNYFDLVVTFNTLHNLYNYELDEALIEINRVSKGKSYICVESYRNEKEKMNYFNFIVFW